MVFDPTLFSYASHVDQRRIHAHTLLVSLGSYVDAGHTQRILVEHLRNTLTSHSLGEFDADRVLDYREHRPQIVFDRDHFTDYVKPALTLEQLFDESGEGFLLLDGPEPALRWEAVAASIEHIVDELDVERVIIVQAIPLPSPHTRPVLLTKHATRPELIPGNQPFFGQLLMSAAFPAFLEVRLGEHGRDAIGLSAHVPQYLADTDFPDAAIALIQELRSLTGLRIPTESLAVAAGIVRAQIGAQVAQSEELTQMLGAMEEQYDQAVTQREITRRAEAELPDADEIGEEAEAFLRDMREDAPAGDEPSPREPQTADDEPDDEAMPKSESHDPGDDPEPPAGTASA